MNHVTNDYGKTVPAVGAPGSIERVKVERPKLIDQLNSLYFRAYESPGRAVDEAVEMVRAAGIRSELEAMSVLKASHYGEEKPGGVTDIVLSLATLTKPIGQTPEFRQTWQALMRQLEAVLSAAHRRTPNATETAEAVSVARHLLGKVGDLLLNTNPTD